MLNGAERLQKVQADKATQGDKYNNLPPFFDHYIAAYMV